jgi:uncharacterized membrane protein YecN with MAPEG domain
MGDSSPQVVLVECHEEARQGVPFNLVVTDQAVTYTRMVSFKRYPTETIICGISLIRDARLKRRSPWFLWILGVVLLGFAVMWLWSFFFGEGERSIQLGLCGLMIALAFACFRGGRHRFVLEWNEGDKRHRVVQPLSLSIGTRDRISAALRDAARLLADPAALRLAVAHSREQANLDHRESG